MSNSTTTALPADRRAILRSILASGAVAAVPVAKAIAAPGNPDVELFALLREARLLDAQMERASYVTEAACKRTACPSEPDALRERADDMLQLLRGTGRSFYGGPLVSFPYA